MTDRVSLKRAIKGIPGRRVEGMKDFWKLSPDIDVAASVDDLESEPALAANLRIESGSSKEIEYSNLYKEIVAASGIRVLCKAFETVEAFRCCDARGASSTAAVTSYNAAYFSARAFCLLMGVSQLSRESVWTVSISPGENLSLRRGKRNQSVTLEEPNTARLHRLGRWSHDTVWSVCDRLVRTLTVPDELSDVLADLKRIKLQESSKSRNLFLYDDRSLVPWKGDWQADFSDYPSFVEKSILNEDAPGTAREHMHITTLLVRMCMFLIEESPLNDSFNLYTSVDRRGEMAI